MAVVTDVEWVCPGCGNRNIAQLYEYWYPEDSEEHKPLSHKMLSSHAELKYNPPCEKCGKFQLVEPLEKIVKFPIIRVEDGLEIEN